MDPEGIRNYLVFQFINECIDNTTFWLGIPKLKTK
jgi:hypothetical protein